MRLQTQCSKNAGSAGKTMLHALKPIEFFLNAQSKAGKASLNECAELGKTIVQDISLAQLAYAIA